MVVVCNSLITDYTLVAVCLNEQLTNLSVHSSFLSIQSDSADRCYATEAILSCNVRDSYDRTFPSLEMSTEVNVEEETTWRTTISGKNAITATGIYGHQANGAIIVIRVPFPVAHGIPSTH